MCVECVDTIHILTGNDRCYLLILSTLASCLLISERCRSGPAGVVRTALPDMDREVRDHFLLVVQAKDMIGQMGGLSGTTSVTVMLTDVNDNPPRFPRSE